MEGPASSTAVRLLPSTSESLPSTPGEAMSSVASSFVTYESLLAAGGSLTAPTTMVTVAMPLSASPSEAW